MKRKNVSWQQEIDPALNKFIAQFLRIIEAFKLRANEGYIHINTQDEHFQIIVDSGYPDFKNFYENFNPTFMFSEWSKGTDNADLLSMLDKGKLLYKTMTTGTPDDFVHLLKDITASKEENSRNYYMKWSELASTDTADKYKGNIDLAELVDTQKRLFSDVLSLSTHLALIQTEKGSAELKKVGLPMLQMFLNMAWNMPYH